MQKRLMDGAIRHGVAQVLRQKVSDFLRGLLSKPPRRGVVIVGPGVDHAIRHVVVGQVGVFRKPPPEGKLKHLHAGKVEPRHEGPHVVGDDSQVFGDKGELTQASFQVLEELLSGDGPPLAALRRGILGRDAPTGGKSPEVVDTQLVTPAQGMHQAILPPLERCLSQVIPMVEGVAPTLPRGAKVIRRHPCHRRGGSVAFQQEKIAMAPHIGAVVIHKNRHVSQDMHSLGGAERPQGSPLAKEDVL
ncbi:MAG: hypothetical protein BWY88_00175 [Synergistetes bacterium ADurb.Bin520]|nr:MAG: hypothetical protein BWY88_00175 [Synergistetes bacterium ADurb.Bin520]